MKKLRIALLSMTLLVLAQVNAWAQCAMCRGSVESQVSAGDTCSSQLKFWNPLSLFYPYLIVAVIALLWYRASKHSVKKIQRASPFAG